MNDSAPNHVQGRHPYRLSRLLIIVLCGILLPFNALSILISGNLLMNLRQSYENSIMISLRSQVGTLEQRMDNIDLFLYDHPANDLNFIRYGDETQDWHHELYRRSITVEMQNAMQLSASADGMFVWLPARNDLCSVEHFYIRSSGEIAPRPEEETLRELLRAGHLPLRTWQHLVLDGEDYLLRVVPEETYMIGAYINCNDFLDQLERDGLLKDAFYSLDTTPPEVGRGQLLCACPLGEGGLSLFCITDQYLAAFIFRSLEMMRRADSCFARLISRLANLTARYVKLTSASDPPFQSFLLQTSSVWNLFLQTGTSDCN